MPDTTAHSSPLATFYPPEKKLPLLKMLKVARENGMATIPRDAYRDLVFEIKGMGGTALVVSDPVGVKRVLLDNVANYPKARSDAPFLSATFGDGLLTLEGDRWKAHRRLMSPSFDYRSILSYAPGMVKATQGFLDDWDRRGEGAEIDVAEAMTALTLKIISQAMFSNDSDEIGPLLGSTFEEGLRALDFGLLDLFPVIGPMRMNAKIATIRKVFGKLDSMMYRLIEERTKSGEEKNDLLGRLLSARDAESGIGLTNLEVRDEMVIIFFAGHETTAMTMAFAFYILSQRPMEEAKLHEELARVLGGRAPTYEDIEHLPYTRAIIDETMRLYPSAPGLSGREALEDDEICGIKVKKGTQVFVAPWIIHHHEKLWPDPYEFNPDRFLPEQSKGRPRFAHLPFGGGQRVCIGASLALTEACLILATLAQKYRLRLSPGQDIRLRSRITLFPANGIKMTLSRRAA